MSPAENPIHSIDHMSSGHGSKYTDHQDQFQEYYDFSLLVIILF